MFLSTISLSERDSENLEETAMKTKTTVIFTLTLLSLTTVPAWGIDFSSLSTEELAAKRGTMMNATEEDRKAFRNEWQKRMREFTPEERARYQGRPDNAPAVNRGGAGRQSLQDPSSPSGPRGMGYGQGGGRGGGRGQGR